MRHGHLMSRAPKQGDLVQSLLTTVVLFMNGLACNLTMVHAKYSVH